MKNELPDFEASLNALQAAIEHHRSTHVRGRPFPVDIKKQAIDLLSRGCNVSRITSQCKLEFRQINNWRKQIGIHPGGAVHGQTEPVSLKVLKEEDATDLNSVDNEIASFCIKGHIEGLPFVLSLGSHSSRGR